MMRRWRWTTWTWVWRCFWLEVELTNINRPWIRLDPERRWIAIGWGDSNAPVWSLQIGPRR